jgi:RND family efflux transporter MFP subunit
MTLSQMEGGNRVASLPLRRKEKIIGILTLEFPPEKPGSPTESTALAVAAELLAPQLCDRYDNDRYLITKAGISTKNTTKMIFGLRQHTLAKVLIATAIGVLLFLCLYKPAYRVSAPFAFVPLERRVVDSPFAGVIDEVFKDVGQTVKAGDPILKLDTQPLESELRAARAEQQAAYARARAWLARQNEGPGAMAQHDAEQANAEAAGAKIAKLEEDIRRSTITAPIDGVLLQAPGAADLEERIGTTVQVGDQIVLVGDPKRLRIEIAVADRDIDDVKEGQMGTLATNAEPGKKIPIKVDRIIEAAEATEGTNAFTVYASPVGEPDPFWRPSGTGEVRLDAGTKPLIWQWTHRLVDWVRLKLWI